MEQVVKLLRELGLTQYETDAYLTLVKQGAITARELSNISGVPQPKIYTTLETLEEKHLVQVYPDFPKKYKAINPKVSIENLIENRKANLNKITEISEPEIRQLEADFYQKEESREEYVWFSKGKKEFIERVIEIIEEAEETVDLLTVNFSMCPGLKDAIKKLKKKKVKVRVIGHLTKETTSGLKQYKKLKCEIRNIKHNYPRFAVIDRKTTLVRVGPFHINLMIDNPNFTEIFERFYEDLWEIAKTI